MYYILPLTNDPRQVMTMDLTIDGEGFHARIEVRWLPAPAVWVISIWDDSTGELLINQIRHLRDGKGIGSLFVIRAVDEPSTTDPGENNLTAFKILFGDTYDRET